MKKRKYLYTQTSVLCQSKISALNLPVGSNVLVEITNPSGDSKPNEKGGITLISTQTYGFLTILETGYSFTTSEGCTRHEGHEYLELLASIEYTIRIALPDAPTDWSDWVAAPLWQDANGNLYKEVNGVLGVV
jgi:hypothetical protein